MKIPENFIRERNKVTEAERETHEEIKLRRTKSGREKARRQEGEKKEKESEERGERREEGPQAGKEAAILSLLITQTRWGLLRPVWTTLSGLSFPFHGVRDPICSPRP